MAISNDVIQFWLFPLQSDGSLISDIEELHSYCELYLTHLHSYTDGYIWNRDHFKLKAVQENVGEGLLGDAPPHLYGETNVGDFIEDEWFITFLLLQLTRQFPELVVRVCDTDGEFLLVEAAEHLPEWADPDTADQRVYLHRGQLHLLSPVTVPPSSPHCPLSIMEGVTAVASQPPSHTLASPQIQQAIKLRIQEYPGRVRREQHVGHALVPVGVAALLREYPTLVAPAITAFCSRDALDTKVLRVMRHFPPEQRVMTAVKFSKALYAKLQSHPYTPDPRTGWQLPAPSQPLYAQHLLGVKLACGFELLVCNAGGVTPVTTPQSPDAADNTDAVTDNPRWGRYKKTLSDRGYFRGEQEGSKLYKELECNALRYFSQHMLKSDPNKDKCMDTLSAGAMVIKLLPSVNADLDFFKEREKRLVPADDDAWLNITPEALDEMLESKYGKPDTSSAADGEPTMEGLEAFLSNPSDFEGVEVPADLEERLRKLSTMSLPRRKHSSAVGASRKASHAGRKVSHNLSVHPQARKISSLSVASNSSEMSSFSNKMDFNGDSFMDAVKNVLDLGLPDDDYWQGSDDESSGLSSYGDEDSDDEGTGRKISSGSQDSASSGKGSSTASCGDRGGLRAAMRAMEDELRTTDAGEFMRPQQTEALDSDDDSAENGDEFDDVENFAPVKVDGEAVRDLLKAYKLEGGQGPATTLLRSAGLQPNK